LAAQMAFEFLLRLFQDTVAPLILHYKNNGSPIKLADCLIAARNFPREFLCGFKRIPRRMIMIWW